MRQAEFLWIFGRLFSNIFDVIPKQKQIGHIFKRHLWVVSEMDLFGEKFQFQKKNAAPQRLVITAP